MTAPPAANESPVTASRRRHEIFLVALISAIVVCSAVGGFLIGQRATKDAFIQTVNSKSANERTTLLSAGTAPRSAYQSLGNSIGDPMTAAALAKMYNVPAGDRDALIKRLSEVPGLPPYQPAPFVGHMARPFDNKKVHINSLGFRDRRENLENKDNRTIRIFITGSSVAWGSYISSGEVTFSSLLEKKLNSEISPRTGYRYEVINTGFPAWSTTQEKLLIEQRLIYLHPDVILMFSGSNDVHWALHGGDIRWFYSYMDQNYITLLNEMYKAAGHPEWAAPIPFESQPIDCSRVAEIAQRNVAESTAAAAQVNARVIFVLQPNIISTTKRLSEYELRNLRQQNKPYWDACYQALRDALPRINAANYRFLDLSGFFGTLDQDTELFIDAYHFVDTGSHMIADEIAADIDWTAIRPSVPDSTAKAKQ